MTYLLWSRRKIYKLSWQLPGPFALPLIGNGFELQPNSEWEINKIIHDKKNDQKHMKVKKLLIFRNPFLH